MKTVIFFQEGEPIPDGAKFLGFWRKVGKSYESPHPMGSDTVQEIIDGYLYEVPMEDPYDDSVRPS